jgi:hypothetical protein
MKKKKRIRRRRRIWIGNGEDIYMKMDMEEKLFAKVNES